MATVGLAVLGACAFTVPARAWMRLVSSEPDFTWAGTLGIALGFSILFAGAALNLAARRHGWSRRATWAVRILGAVLILPAFGGAGLLVCPPRCSAALPSPGPTGGGPGSRWRWPQWPPWCWWQPPSPATACTPAVPP